MVCIYPSNQNDSFISDETEDKAKELPRVICQHIRHELKREKELLAHMEELRIVPISP